MFMLCSARYILQAISVARLNKKLVEALESEIDILQKLRHPNIVQLLRFVLFLSLYF